MNADEVKKDDLSLWNVQKVNTTYWIAENMRIDCYTKLNWFNRLMVRLVFGWKVEVQK